MTNMLPAHRLGLAVGGQAESPAATSGRWT